LPILSEALRGEGALLRNSELKRFMPEYHQAAELAPRDVVARAIVHELEKSKTQPAVVYLDMRHLDAEHLRKRFPRIYQTCAQYNLDIAMDLIPVRPAAHYLMGGVKIDLEGRTNVPGLFAAGEAACTGVHGANRLASNSLLEGLVFGARAAHAMRKELREARDIRTHASEESGSNRETPFSELKKLMWSKAGVIRSGTGLTQARQKIGQWHFQNTLPSARREIEDLNLLTIAHLICRSALAREESRGAHYRTDFPRRDDRKFRKHSVIRNESISFE